MGRTQTKDIVFIQQSSTLELFLDIIEIFELLLRRSQTIVDIVPQDDWKETWIGGRGADAHNRSRTFSACYGTLLLTARTRVCLTARTRTIIVFGR